MSPIWRKLRGASPRRLVSVGVPALDSDHRCLVRVIDLLLGIERDDDASAMIPTVLETVSVYAWFHFQREEHVMEAIGFPGSKVHRQEHRAFTRRLDDLRRSHDESCCAADAANLWTDLSAWLRHHVLLQDMAYKPLVTASLAADQVARAGSADSLLEIGGVPVFPSPWDARPAEAFALAL